MRKALIVILFCSIATFAQVTYTTTRSVQCANTKTCLSDPVEQVDNISHGIFLGQKVIPPKMDLQNEAQKPVVLGIDVPAGKKHIYVSLEDQVLYAYQGAREVIRARVSTGRWGWTPTGNFNIYIKLRSTRMAGGQGADAYDLPNVPHTMYYDGDYGIHGAYWHNNFGYPMSHGCINLRLTDAERLFAWAEGPTASQKGTPVSVCDRFTGPDTCEQDNPKN